MPRFTLRDLFCLPLMLGISWLISAGDSHADDWAMGGRTRDRNPVSPEKNAPTDWQIEKRGVPSRNIRWSAAVGRHAFGGPVVANGLIWVGTNNDPPLDPAVEGDRGVLACFREADGKFLYQYTSPRLEKYTSDWPSNGLSGSPIVEGDKLWFITNRREVVCLDTGPLRRGVGLPTVVWRYDLVSEQGVLPESPMLHGHNTLGSLAIQGELLFVPTGNRVVDPRGASQIKMPEAPSLICLRKDTGKMVWKDSSAGKLGFGGHHVSPLVMEIGGKHQVIHAQADGWVRSFDVETGKLIWSFDTNYKDSAWEWTNWKDKQKWVVAANPVFAAGRVYFGAGRDVEFSGPHGRLFCLDPNKAGDISPELDDGKGGGMKNPNSGLIWDYASEGEDDTHKMHQTLSAVAVHDGLAIVPDQYTMVHCLDAQTGKRHWSHDTTSTNFGDPLIVDGKIYVANDNGDVTILKLSKTYEVIATREIDNTIVASPIFANGILYIQTVSKLYAIGPK